MLAETLQRDPANGNARVNLAAHRESMGDILLASGKAGDALQMYRESLRVVEERPLKVAAGPRVTISVSAKLAELAAKQGAADQAITIANHTVSIAEKIGESDPVATQVLRARAYESMGSVQDLLRHPIEARQWRARALAEYRKFTDKPEFPKALRSRVTALEKLVESGDKQ
jgi:tetratricopeptide (TPR) repeat protein